MSYRIFIIGMIAISLLISGCAGIDPGLQNNTVTVTPIATSEPTIIPTVIPSATLTATLTPTHPATSTATPTATAISTITPTPTPVLKDVGISVLRKNLPNPTKVDPIYTTVLVEVTGGKDVSELTDLSLYANDKEIRPIAKAYNTSSGGVIKNYSYDSKNFPSMTYVKVYGRFKDGTTQKLWEGYVQ